MKKILKKLLAVTLISTLVFTLASCGKKDGEDTNPDVDPSTSAESEGGETSLSGEPVTLKVGATPSPHAELLNLVKPMLKAQGVELEVVEFSDYVPINPALAEGSLDANYFQHEDFLNEFNSSQKANLAVAGYIHYEPMGIYAGKTAKIEDLKDGAKIAVPNDATNEARALLLLENQGIIKLKKDVGIKATIKDIEENPKNIKIEELDASQIPSFLPDVDLAVINGNFALSANVLDKVILVEDENSVAINFTNIIATTEENKNNPAVQLLIKELKSDTVKEYIEATYGKTVVIDETK